VQQPIPPIWVAGVVSDQRPLLRRRRWDGIVSIGATDLLRPDARSLARYQGEVQAGWDVDASWVAGVPAKQYAEVGVTWLMDSASPTGDWVDECHVTREVTDCHPSSNGLGRTPRSRAG
jgi:hypothetical protein